MSYVLYSFPSINLDIHNFIQIVFLFRLAILTKQREESCLSKIIKNPAETFSTLNRKIKSTCIKDDQSVVS